MLKIELAMADASQKGRANTIGNTRLSHERFRSGWTPAGGGGWRCASVTGSKRERAGGLEAEADPVTSDMRRHSSELQGR
jgi:hypothetical protein